jgi:small subunit ribosomal protein S3
MGQKVNPIGLRLGINRNWDSRWFPGKQTLATSIGEDYKIRTFLKKELYYAGVSQILIERTAKKLRVTVVAARPGIIIGKKGSDIEKLRVKLTKLIDKDVNVNIKEERRPQSSAQLCAENVAMQLERRVAFRRAMKKVIQGAQKSGPEFLLNFPKSIISKGLPSESLKSNFENILYFHRYWSRFSFMVS